MRSFLLSFLLLLGEGELYSFCENNPFNYELSVKKIGGDDSRVMVASHGMGGNFQIIDRVVQSKSYSGSVVGFNFPDYDGILTDDNALKTSYGTIEELLPEVFVLKCIASNPKVQVIDLFGYSAGGGVIINTLSLLNGNRFDDDLLKIGVTPSDKKQILEKIKKGIVILDAPLKSMQEIEYARGETKALDILVARFQKNGMEPINAIEGLKGLKLNILVHFQVPDEVLSNRDDDLFIKRLKEVNPGGNVFVSIGQGGHSQPHPLLWENFGKILKAK